MNSNRLNDYYTRVIWGAVPSAMILITLVCIPSVYADEPAADYSHSQGDGFQCATGPTQQMECQMLNAMKFWFPQIVQELQWQNGNLTKQIQNQNKIIENQQKEIESLNKMVQNTTPQVNTPQKTTTPQNEQPTKQFTGNYGNTGCRMTPQGVRC